MGRQPKSNPVSHSAADSLSPSKCLPFKSAARLTASPADTSSQAASRFSCSFCKKFRLRILSRNFLGQCIYVLIVLFVFVYNAGAFEYENTADNPRLVNLTPQQFKALNTIEKRLYSNSYDDENTMDRIERLELDFFHEIQKGSPSKRINALKLESSRVALRGTPMTPMMNSTFNTKYINQKSESLTYYDDVGIIDGLIRVWWPDFYAKISEYRKYKEANFY